MIIDDVEDVSFQEDPLQGQNTEEESDVELNNEPHTPAQYIRNPISDREWEAAVYLTLKEKFFCPFTALEYVSSSMHEFHQKTNFLR